MSHRFGSGQQLLGGACRFVSVLVRGERSDALTFHSVGVGAERRMMTHGVVPLGVHTECTQAYWACYATRGQMFVVAWDVRGFSMSFEAGLDWSTSLQDGEAGGRRTRRRNERGRFLRFVCREARRQGIERKSLYRHASYMCACAHLRALINLLVELGQEHSAEPREGTRPGDNSRITAVGFRLQPFACARSHSDAVR